MAKDIGNCTRLSCRKYIYIFDYGRKNKGLKISAALMLARLKEKYSNSFVILSEETIKKFIKASFARQKAGEQKHCDAKNPTDSVTVVEGACYAARMQPLYRRSLRKKLSS